MPGWTLMRWPGSSALRRGGRRRSTGPRWSRRWGCGCRPTFITFASAYGPITLGEFVWVWSPVGAAAQLDYGTHRMLRAWRDRDPPGHPYTFWPEPGGLLMWGRSGASHHFFWHTAASTDPQRWPTVVYSYLMPAGYPGMYSASGPVWRRLERPMTDVLAALVGGGPDPQLGLDLDPLPARYEPSPRTDATAEPTGAPQRPAVATPDAVERIVDAIGVVPPVPPADRSGEQLPSDYQALIDRIGAGTLGRRLILHAPNGPRGYDLTAEHTRIGPTLRVPAAVCPQPGGLRLWGRFTTGETCWWLPAWYDCDGWPVVICAADAVGWQRLDLTATQFIDEWLAGRMDLPVLAPEALPADRTWRSAAEELPAPPPRSARRRDPLAQLATLIGPPDINRDADWSTAERRLGVRLPDNYKRLHAAYGAWFVEGISAPPPGQLADWQEQLADIYLDDRPAFPHPGGLLYCAGTENRDALWWDTTDADPDAWPVVIQSAGHFSTFPGNLTELLVHTLTDREPDLPCGTPSSPPRRQ